MKRSICIFLALLAAFLLLPAPSAFAGAALYEGIDLSVWQGTVDFNQVKADGKEIVYIRAGEGTQEDTRFAENAAGAKGAGLKFGFFLCNRPKYRSSPSAGGIFCLPHRTLWL